MFSQLQALNRHLQKNDVALNKNVEKALEEATQHSDFCAMLYQHQLRHGRHFLHEHPWGASSWKVKIMQEMLADGRVYHAQAHMCRLGMESHVKEKNGEKGLAKKPTGFMSSSECIVQELANKCMGGHKHLHLMGGRAAAAQVYPQPFANQY